MPTSSAQTPVRVRFAPSPTGFLHIGGVRTALFNWLYARAQGGQFLLRIEDTDLERSEQRYTDDILASMKWLGLTWDEVPLKQSERLALYRQRAEELITRGLAYRCDCTEEMVDEMRKTAQAAGKKPMYDRRCRDRALSDADARSSGKPFVIRAKIPLDGAIEFLDLIRGTIRVENTEVDDFVLIRSNGAPTYNLSVVIDDVDSRMTHIIRGDDHINNTPKQLHLYNFFSYPHPKFAHLPMILGADKQKLSKRHGAVSANAYRGDGYLPETLLGFLARCGWSHGDQEDFTVQELIQFFGFDHVQKSSAVFNVEKLNWLSGVHLRKAAPERLAQILCEDFKEHFSGEGLKRLTSPLGARVVALTQQKCKTLREMAEMTSPLVAPGVVEVDAAQIKWGKVPGDAGAKAVLLSAIKDMIATLGGRMAGTEKVTRGLDDLAWGASPSFGDAGIPHTEVDALVKQVAEKHGIKVGELMGPVRVVVTGRAVSVGVFDLLTILPWDLVEARLQKALAL